MLHLNCTPLSQSESSNFFMCITIPRIIVYRKGDQKQGTLPLLLNLVFTQSTIDFHRPSVAGAYKPQVNYRLNALNF